MDFYCFLAAALVLFFFMQVPLPKLVFSHILAMAVVWIYLVA